MTVSEIKDRIRAYRREMGWSKVRLASEAGISGSNVLSHMDEDGWNPTSNTLEALARVIPTDWTPETGRPEQAGAA